MSVDLITSLDSSSLASYIGSVALMRSSQTHELRWLQYVRAGVPLIYAPRGPTPFLGDASLIAARFWPANRVTQSTQLERIVGRNPFSALLSMLASGPSKRYNWANSTTEEASVAQLIVRDLSEDLVKALKQRAAKRNRSTEQEHREILQSVLRS